MRRFPAVSVRLPSGDRYWTVVNGYRPVLEADEWLLHVRLGAVHTSPTIRPPVMTTIIVTIAAVMKDELSIILVTALRLG